MFRAFVSSILTRVLVYSQLIHLASVVAMAAATEYPEGPQMKELINKEASLTAQIELSVSRSVITAYSYIPRGAVRGCANPKIPNAAAVSHR